MNISVIGLGKMGLPLAVAYASKGHQVLGIDKDKKLVNLLSAGSRNSLNDIVSSEPFVQEHLEKYADQMHYTTDLERAIAETDLTFIITQTPSIQSGDLSLQYVSQVCTRLGKTLRKKEKYHLIVVSSTIPPKSCENVLIPRLEELSGKKCGRHFGFCYSPELMAGGEAVSGYLTPDFFLIGESDDTAGSLLESFYKTIGESPIIHTSIANAELVKLAINCFITTKISFANMIGEFEAVPGINPHEVMDIVSTDSRINPKFMRPGVMYGGPCFNRDNAAMIATAQKYQIASFLPVAVDQTNQYQLNRFLRLIQQEIGVHGTVSVLGLAYKPGVSSIENAMGVAFAELLLESEYQIKVYDPKAMPNTKKVLQNRVIYCNTTEECITDTDVIFVAMRWPEFKTVLEERKDLWTPVIDPWGLL